MRNYEGYTELTSTSGIYLLLLDNVVVYAGQSKNLYHRVDVHRQEQFIKFNCVLFKLCGVSELDELEARAINQYKPRFNKIIPQISPIHIDVDISSLIKAKYWKQDDGRRCK